MRFVATALALVASLAQAQSFPSKPIRIVVPYTAGGPADLLVRALGQKLTGLAIAGPKAREVLAKVTRADVSNATFPFMAVARMDIGMAPCLVGRVSYTGDLGYEIWVAPEYQRAAFQTLMAAGVRFSVFSRMARRSS